MTEPAQPVMPPVYSREILDIFDGYVHGVVDRRGFLDRCAAYVGGLAAAEIVLAALVPDFARAQLIAEDDRRIAISRIDIASPKGSGTIKAYVARPVRPSRNRKPGVVLVVHENRGLNPHIEDIARRLAVDGYIAVAPDALTALGGYPGTEDAARALFAKLDQVKIAADFVAAAGWCLALPQGNGKLGAVGFCYGGSMVNTLATAVPELRAAVPFYGSPPALADVAKIKAELLVQHAGNDTRLAGTWPGYDAALSKAGVRHAGYVYANVEHGFNNDTTPRFDKAAAALAWGRTIALFARTLR